MTTSTTLAHLGTRPRIGRLLALAVMASTAGDSPAMTLRVESQRDTGPWAFARDTGKQKAQWKRETYGKPRR